MLVVSLVLVLAALSVAALVWFSPRRRLAALLAVLVLGVLFAAVAARVVWLPARIEGRAMDPTLRDQDRVVVNLFAYRTSAPRRGDVIMLRYPADPRKSFVKRILAVEGDRVQLRAGRVFVNDSPVDDSYVTPEHRSRDDWGPHVIPPASYFVLGDYRSNSSDSRHWGFVPRRYVVGKVQARLWPGFQTF